MFQSQDVLEKYRHLLGTLKDRFDNTVLVGVLPRLNTSQYALSRAIGINSKLQQMCKEANVGFIDAWTDYINNRKFYARDRIHLSDLGSEYLAYKISKHISIQMNANFH